MTSTPARRAGLAPRRVAALACVGALLCAAAVTHARVPSSNRLLKAIAATNSAGGRQQALKLELSLQIGERADVATAELVSHPSGLARLELRGAGDLVERHLMQGNHVEVSRNGQRLEVHRAFLPPFFILQADTMETLQLVLESFEVDTDLVGLAECGERDCLLLGDPDQAVPIAPPAPLPGTEIYADPEAEAEDGFVIEEESTRPGLEAREGTIRVIGAQADIARGPADADAPVRHPARLWVDTESYEVRGFDTTSGVRVEYGPTATFDKLRVPAWILIEEPGKAPARFDVMRAARVAAPASEFTQDWLLAPIMGVDPNAEVLPVD